MITFENKIIIINDNHFGIYNRLETEVKEFDKSVSVNQCICLLISETWSQGNA